MKTSFTIILVFSLLFGLCVGEETAPLTDQQLSIEEKREKIKKIIELLEKSKSENNDNEKIKQIAEQILQAKSDEDFLNIHLSLLEAYPDHPDLLNVLALLTWKMGKVDEAKKYIDKSLTIKKTDQSLEILTLVYAARKDYEGLYKNLKDLEAVEEKSPILLIVLLVLSEQNKDVELYQRTSIYIKNNKIADIDVIRAQQKLTKILQDAKLLKVDKQ